MKKLKCIKCGTYFKDRQDPRDMNGEIETIKACLCWDCRFIYLAMQMFMESLKMIKKREVMLDFNNLYIRKRPTQSEIQKKLKIK